MKCSSRQGTVTLNSYQEFMAVTLGGERSSVELPPCISEAIADAHKNWTLPAQPLSSWQRKGWISDFLHRSYPDVVINGGEEWQAVMKACNETLAVGGLKGAYHKVRGFRKAARSIIGGLEQIDEAYTTIGWAAQDRPESSGKI